MRSSQHTSELSQQFERALALMEAQQTLEAERRSLSEAQRASERLWFEDKVREILLSHETIRQEVAAEAFRLGEKLDRLYEIVGIPRDTEVPTLAEQLNAAQTDENVRKEIQRMFAEMEFENTELEFN